MERFQCEFCNRSYATRGNKQRHQRSHSDVFPCRFCQRAFARRDNVKKHERICGIGSAARTYDRTMSSMQHGGADNIQKSLNGSVIDQTFLPYQESRQDLLVFLANVKGNVKTVIQKRLTQEAIKWYVVAQVELYREDGNGEIKTAVPYFRSLTYTSLTKETFSDTDLNEAFQKVYANFEKYIRESSGWILKTVKLLKLHMTSYSPISGSSFLNIPYTLKRSNCILNIKNTEDNKCFVWSVLAKRYPVNCESNNVNSYNIHEQTLDMCGIQYPVSISQIDKFERQNRDYSINVFGYENKTIIPLRISKRKDKLCHIDLLLIFRENTSHYCLILNLNAFLFRTRSSKKRHYFCRYCLNGFSRPTLLSSYMQYCSRHKAQYIVLPKKHENDTLKFHDFRKQLRLPVETVEIYCDFETLNRPIDTCMPNPETPSTTANKLLDVSSFGYKVVCIDSRYTKPTVVFRGENASENFLESLLKEQQSIENILHHNEPIRLTSDDRLRFESATHCEICCQRFVQYETRVYDNCHLTGRCRTIAHVVCNLLYTTPNFIPVIFHGLRNFDSHIICQQIGKFEKNGEIKVIPKYFENYTSLSLGNLRFLDSYQFMNASLEKLIANLKCDNSKHKFVHFYSEFQIESVADMLLRKNVFPYNYMTIESKFEETTLQ